MDEALLGNQSSDASNYIDAHQHFWKYDAVRDSWIDESMKAIQRDFLPRDLQPVLQKNGFSGCVVVQSDQSEIENEFQLANAEQFDFIKGVVGWVDLRSPQVEERLAFYKSFKKMKGFRHVLQGESRRDIMLDPAFMKGIGLLHKYNFTYDILIYTDQLRYINHFVKAFPYQRFVINHLAKPHIKTHQIDDWKEAIASLSTFENVYCKISGMVTEADWIGWKQEDFTPYLDVVVEAFGTNRIMFGSDWPVCLMAASYADVFDIVKNYFQPFSREEQERIFKDNAIQFYDL